MVANYVAQCLILATLVGSIVDRLSVQCQALPKFQSCGRCHFDSQNYSLSRWENFRGRQHTQTHCCFHISSILDTVYEFRHASTVSLFAMETLFDVVINFLGY